MIMVEETLETRKAKVHASKWMAFPESELPCEQTQLFLLMFVRLITEKRAVSVSVASLL